MYSSRSPHTKIRFEVQVQRQALLQSNIRKNYAFFFLTCLRPSNGVWMIYLAANGYSLLQLGILEGIFHIASFLGEVPTGAIADLKGRANSRKLGRVLYVIATLLVMSAYSYTVIVIGFIVYALSFNLESGAGEAFIYDTLEELDRTEEFKKVNGNLEVMYQAASILGLLVGGYLALYSYHALYLLEALVSICALWIGFSMVEPMYEISTGAANQARGVLARTVASLKSQTAAGPLELIETGPDRLREITLGRKQICA